MLTDPEQLRADLDEAGLAVCSVHAKILGDDGDAMLRGARAVGAGTVIVPWADPSGSPTPRRSPCWPPSSTRPPPRPPTRGCGSATTTTTSSCRRIVGGRPALEVLADALDPAVILEVDTYWAAVGGQDVPALLRRLGDRVRYLHVKDGPIGTREGDMMVAVGSGRMPVADILAACPSAEWHVVELDRCATDMLTAVGDSLAWLAAHDLAQPVQRGPVA